MHHGCGDALLTYDTVVNKIDNGLRIHDGFAALGIRSLDPMKDLSWSTTGMATPPSTIVVTRYHRNASWVWRRSVHLQHSYHGERVCKASSLP